MNFYLLKLHILTLSWYFLFIFRLSWRPLATGAESCNKVNTEDGASTNETSGQDSAHDEEKKKLLLQLEEVQVPNIDTISWFN